MSTYIDDEFEDWLRDRSGPWVSADKPAMDDSVDEKPGHRTSESDGSLAGVFERPTAD